jgi:hypothetical protein
MTNQRHDSGPELVVVRRLYKPIRPSRKTLGFCYNGDAGEMKPMKVHSWVHIIFLDGTC